MKCKDVEKKIILSFSGDLDPKAQRVLEEHLKRCPTCAQKYEEIEKELQWMVSISEQVPKFEWETSWTDFRKRLVAKMRTRERRTLQIRRFVPAAAAVFLFLGIFIGRFVLYPPAAGPTQKPLPPGATSRLVQKYMEDVGMTLLEYVNREFLATDQRILTVEKQKARFLLFQNRNLQALLEDSKNSIVIPLLNDLEMVLYETSNLEPGNSESHRFIKTIIKEKDIFFRMRFVKKHLVSNREKEIIL